MLAHLTELLLALLSWATFAPLAFQFSMGCCCDSFAECQPQGDDWLDDFASSVTYDAYTRWGGGNDWTITGGRFETPSSGVINSLLRCVDIGDMSGVTLTAQIKVYDDLAGGGIPCLIVDSPIYHASMDPGLPTVMLQANFFLGRYGTKSNANINNHSITPADGDELKIVMTKVSTDTFDVEYYVNGSLIQTYTSQTYTGFENNENYIGPNHLNAAQVAFDDFSVTFT